MDIKIYIIIDKDDAKALLKKLDTLQDEGFWDKLQEVLKNSPLGGIMERFNPVRITEEDRDIAKMIKDARITELHSEEDEDERRRKEPEL